MTVEFRCTRCQRLLRTPDGSAGRQTQCPECGEMLTVPGQSNPFAQSPLEAPPPIAARGAANPYQSPTAESGPVEAAPGDIVPTRIDLGDVLTRGWTIFQSQLGMVVLGVFLAGVLSYVPNQIISVLAQVATAAGIEPLVIVALQVVLMIGLWAFQIWISLGQSAYLLQIARGERPAIGVLFSGGRYFVKGFLGGLLLILMFLPVGLICFGPAGIVYVVTQDEQIAGIALLIGLPVFMFVSIWLSLTFSYFQMAIVDRECGPLESLYLSRSITQGNKLTLFAMGLVMMVLYLAGFLACCIGAIFTGSYAMLTMFGVAYLCMTGQPTADQFLPPRVNVPIAPPPA